MHCASPAPVRPNNRICAATLPPEDPALLNLTVPPENAAPLKLTVPPENPARLK